MATKKSGSPAFAEKLAALERQFRALDPKDPSRWPLVPRMALYLVVALAVAAGLWFAFLTDYEAQLVADAAKEVSLRDDYQKKLTKAVNLDALKKQKEQIQQYVVQLEKQLPSKAEIGALLSDVNQAGLGRNLQFEMFKPGAVAAKDYYAELPIAIRVTGKYHDIGGFASDIANLSRIVTLNNITIAPGGGRDPGTLTMDATARTYRYLVPEEVQSQKKAKGAK